MTAVMRRAEERRMVETMSSSSIRFSFTGEHVGCRDVFVCVRRYVQMFEMTVHNRAHHPTTNPPKQSTQMQRT